MFKLDSPLMNFLSKLADLMKLNILALVFCLPVITAGASITSLYYISYKMLKNEDGYIGRGFLKAFKDNFIKSTLIWLVQLFVFFILFMDFRIFVYSGMTFSKPIIVAVIACSIVFYLGMVFALPLQARFENTVWNTIKNSFLMFLSHLPTTVLLVIISVIPVVIMCFVTQSIIFFILLGMAGVAYLQSFFILRVFKPYEETFFATQKEEKAGEESVDAIFQDKMSEKEEN